MYFVLMIHPITIIKVCKIIDGEKSIWRIKGVDFKISQVEYFYDHRKFR